jgi:hypothetical protein
MIQGIGLAGKDGGPAGGIKDADPDALGAKVDTHNVRIHLIPPELMWSP